MWSQKYLHDEINFEFEMFVENGNERGNCINEINSNTKSIKVTPRILSNYRGYQPLGQK